jgi:type IV pilus assembly protein PilQ
MPANACTHEIIERGRPSEANAYTGQKISMDFRDADIVNVLRILAEIAGENIIITDDVKGRITLRLADVPADQALDLLLQMNHLGCTEVFTWKTAPPVR